MAESNIPVLDIPLHRLLKRQDAAALLKEFESLLPAGELALVGADGHLFAGTGTWPRAQVAELLARAGDGALLRGGRLLLLPLLVNAQLAGALVARDDGAEAGLRPLACSLALLLAQGLERRDLVRETLDRYREINLLYNIGETIGSLLNPEDVTRVVLGEANRILDAGAGLVWLPRASTQEPADLQVMAAFGEPAYAEKLDRLGRLLVEQVYSGGRPAIVTDLPAGPLVCAPLKTHDKVLGVILLGRPIGEPVFTAGDEKLLMALANQAAIALERARLHQEEIQRQRLEEELAIGRQIQLSLLPEACPAVDGWEFAAVYQPARQVGGDLYDFLELPGEPRRLGLLIADVTDKGVPAALFMAFSRTIIRTESMGGGAPGPAAALARANRSIVRDVPADSRLFLSAFYATLEVHSGRMSYANGGHNWPLWVCAASSEVRELNARGMMLGIFHDIDLEEQEIEVAPGDLLIFYTDGVTEARDAHGRMFDEERLRRVAAASRGASAEQVAQSIMGAVQTFIGDTPPSDDLTLLVVKRNHQT